MMKISKVVMEKHLPLIAMILNQFINAAMALLSKAAISAGMKPSVFVAYRQAAATLVLAPLAYYFHRKKSPPLTVWLLLKIYIVSSCGIALSLNLHYVSLNYVSATFATAFTNTVPAMVFILAVCFRIEGLELRQKHGWAKLVGSVLSITGAMVITFYKGLPLFSSSRTEVENSFSKTYSKAEWIKGSLLLFGSNLAWSIWLLSQSPILKEYPTKLRLSCLQCAFSCLTTALYGAIVERNISSWKLGWNVSLLSIGYCGIVVTAITYSVQIWVVDKRGPVYTAIFSPLALILTAIFSALLFHEAFYWGSVLGGIVLIFGLYAFLWGKNKELKISAGEQQQKMDPSKDEPHLEA